MPRPVKWSRDLHPIRESAQRSRTETWSRQDIERLFDVSRPSAQNLMKAIGAVQSVGAAHFVDRSSLLGFLDEMIAAESVEGALRAKHEQASPAPQRRPRHVALPADRRNLMLPELPANVSLSPGRIVITGDTVTEMVEALLSLAMVMQNDLDRWEAAVRKESIPSNSDQELQQLMHRLRANAEHEAALATGEAALLSS